MEGVKMSDVKKAGLAKIISLDLFYLSFKYNPDMNPK